jgi:hypothetical protein
VRAAYTGEHTGAQIMGDDGALLVPITSGPNGVSAKLGGIGRTKIYGLIDEGELTKVNIGRRSFVTTESIVDISLSMRAETNPIARQSNLFAGN